jgi:hypothetical protein
MDRIRAGESQHCAAMDRTDADGDLGGVAERRMLTGWALQPSNRSLVAVVLSG